MILTVTEDFSGERIDVFIADETELSRSAAKIGVFVEIMEGLAKDRQTQESLAGFVKCVLEKSGMSLMNTEKNGLAVGGRTYDKLTFEYRGKIIGLGKGIDV